MRRGPFRLGQARTSARRGVAFRFNGRLLAGRESDTLASALLANGVRVVARSFKYRRPRGVFSAGVEEPNALLQIGSGARTTPSCRATRVGLSQGLEARSQAGWPGVGFDLGRILDFVAPVLSAGFYYKTFMAPGWHTYEKAIRNLAGLGRPSAEADPDRYETSHLHCDVLVVGAGIAGLEAAVEAAHQGARVLLVDQNALAGGRALWDGSEVDGRPAALWIEERVRQLCAQGDTRLLTGTTAVGSYDHGVYTCVEQGAEGGAVRERLWIVRAPRVVLATGLIEQPMVFCHNDRPGIMLAGAAWEYLRRHDVAVGRRVLVATNNDSAYPLAEQLRAVGVDVVALLDSRDAPAAGLVQQMNRAGIPVHAATMPVDTRGCAGLRAVRIGALSDRGREAVPGRWIGCDALAISGGFSPALQLLAQAGGALRFTAGSGALEAVRVPEFMQVAGAARATGGAGIGPRIAPIGNRRRQWVDLAHDVTVADLDLALLENYASIEHIKRYTTVGMAVDQGKTSAVLALETIARASGRPAAELGYTTMRPPFMPVTLGTLAGREIGERFAPYRHVPLHAWHCQQGALMEEYGEWRRAAVYPLPGEAREAAIRREMQLVRGGLGLFDASPLGKIEIVGPDALEFLDAFYINNLQTLKPGMTRYGLMLRESGTIFDDGTIVMLDPERYLISTTSGNAGRVQAWLEEWHQCEWPRLRLTIVPVTEQWGTIAITGTAARRLLAALEPDIDVSNAAFPHLGMRECRLLAAPARIFRVSFSGELTYEVNAPAGTVASLMEAMIERGREFGARPYGIEAQLRLRTEKAFLHVGTDTNGTTLPDDVGYGRVAMAKPRDFIGRRSLTLPDSLRGDRLQLVGLSAEPDGDMPIGAHVRCAASQRPTDGWVTSACRMTLDGRAIALALVAGGRSREGEAVTLHDFGRTLGARIVRTPFFDPAGERMRG